MKLLKLIGLLIILVISTNGYTQKKVAVVSFFADKAIDISTIDAGADFILQNTSLSENPDFNLQEELEAFHTAFFNEYVQGFPFETIQEKEVLNNNEYVSFVPDYAALSIPYDKEYYNTIEGYKLIRNFTPFIKKQVLPMTKSMNVDGIMLVYITFRFNKTGVGKLGYMSIQAIANIKLYNMEGKSIFDFHELAGSKKKAPMVGGIPVMNPQKIVPMCKSAIEELMKDMNKKITRLAKKVDRKF